VAALETLLSIAFAGLAFGAVLYLVSVGLSITMGLLGIANLAHGAFAAIGGYLAFYFANKAGVPYLLAIACAAILTGAGSFFLERTLYAKVYDAGELEQVLLSIGLVFITTAGLHFAFGPVPTTIQPPSYLLGSIDTGWRTFPTYRVFLIASGFAAFIILWLGIERTDLGAKIRAAVDNRHMAEAIGINTARLFSVVFALGSALAALGGALGTEVISLTPGYGLEHLLYFLIVVSVGGLGSIKGPFFAALLLGVGDAACKILVPEFGSFFILVAVFLLILAMPQGLFGRSQ